jgi:dipeptidyl-peptidase-3
MDALRKLAQSSSSTARDQLETVIGPMLSGPPFVLGYRSERAQSTYYPGKEKVTKEEISLVSKVLEDHKVELENTRLQKVIIDGKPVVEVLQASTNEHSIRQWDNIDGLGTVRIRGGDHAEGLAKVCESLLQAKG